MICEEDRLNYWVDLRARLTKSSARWLTCCLKSRLLRGCISRKVSIPFGPAIPKQTVPMGLSFVPPVGPAIPVIEML